MKLLPSLSILLLFLPGCPCPAPAAPLDAEQVRIVKQIEQRADNAEKALASEHQAHLDAEQSMATASAEAARLGQIAADAQAQAVKWEAVAVAETRAKHHAWELLAAVVLAGLLLIVLVGRQVETVLRALGVAAVHEVLEIPGLLKSVLKLASLLAIF